MIARMQRLTTLALLAAAIACAVLLARQGHPAWAVAAFCAVICVPAAFMALEFALVPLANRHDPAPPAGAATLVRAWAHEGVTALGVFCWQQPFRSQAEPDHLPPSAAGQVGVVFVHGFVCNRGLWNPWLKRLRQRDVPFVAVDLEPVFGPIERYAAIVERAVRQVEAATATRPLIVAHSMGGLAVRAWLDAFAGDARVSHVITLGTPHRGTLLARFGLAANARQMRWQGAWLKAMAEREPAARRALFTCFYSHCDNIVMPASTATLPGADNRHVSGVAHVQLSRDDDVLSEVLRRAGRPG